ncbi:hypothetical protein [Halosaccharopolyspora lacisalsi]|nr:hypothetical protein [Halosaccharopolyspora lacisalsi]
MVELLGAVERRSRWERFGGEEGSMKFGVNIVNHGWVAEPEHFRGWARFPEWAGLHAALVSDHVAVTPDVAEP